MMFLKNNNQKERHFYCMLFSNVNEEEFEYVNEFEQKGIIYKEVRLKNRGCKCECGTYHTNVKEYRTKKITHSVNDQKNGVLPMSNTPS